MTSYYTVKTMFGWELWFSNRHGKQIRLDRMLDAKTACRQAARMNKPPEER